MTSFYQIKQLNESESNEDSFFLDALEGLSSNPKFIPAKYHYDEKGSQLFERITELDDYYQTRSEQEILRKFKTKIAEFVSLTPTRVIELGVGDGHKTKELLAHFLEKGLEFEYVPIDCCQSVIDQLIFSLQSEFGQTSLKTNGIVADYFTALSWIKQSSYSRNFVFFLGSSIGNFDNSEAKHFLRHLWSVLHDGDYILIGFDLKKDIHFLEKSYDDSLGVTRDFNLNLLDRLNRELGANFVKDQFVYHSFYNPTKSRIESWLISNQDQAVTVKSFDKVIRFEAWEGIHVENSHKYNLSEIKELANETGFTSEQEFLDSKKYFVNVIWRVKKNQRA